MSSQEIKDGKIGLALTVDEFDETKFVETVIEAVQGIHGPGRGVQSCGFRAARDLGPAIMRFCMQEMDRGTEPGVAVGALVDTLSSGVCTVLINTSGMSDEECVKIVAKLFRDALERDLRRARVMHGDLSDEQK